MVFSVARRALTHCRVRALFPRHHHYAPPRHHRTGSKYHSLEGLCFYCVLSLIWESQDYRNLALESLVGTKAKGKLVTVDNIKYLSIMYNDNLFLLQLISTSELVQIRPRAI